MTERYCVLIQHHRLRPRWEVLVRDCVERQANETALHGLMSLLPRYTQSPVTGYAGCSVRRNRLRLTECISTLS